MVSKLLVVVVSAVLAAATVALGGRQWAAGLLAMASVVLLARVALAGLLAGARAEIESLGRMQECAEALLQHVETTVAHADALLTHAELVLAPLDGLLQPGAGSPPPPNAPGRPRPRRF